MLLLWLPVHTVCEQFIFYIHQSNLRHVLFYHFWPLWYIFLSCSHRWLVHNLLILDAHYYMSREVETWNKVLEVFKNKLIFFSCVLVLLLCTVGALFLFIMNYEWLSFDLWVKMCSNMERISLDLVQDQSKYKVKASLYL